MPFLFAYAGFSGDVFTEIYNRKDEISGTNTEFLGRAYRGKVLDRVEADFYLKAFEKIACDELYQENNHTHFAVIYLKPPALDVSPFYLQLFPGVLAFHVEWILEGETPRLRRQSINTLITTLRLVSVSARNALEVLAPEMREKSNRTPLLLPPKNFNSKIFTPALLSMQMAMRDEQNKQQVIKEAIQKINHHHPLQTTESGKYKNRQIYVDDLKIEFHPPGKDRHGLARSNDKHSSQCIVNAYRRLGVWYDPRFHYDCTKSDTSYRSDFFGCHSPKEQYDVKRHINIAPNDFVRNP